MRIASLELFNVRAIKAAELHFQPGFNLVAGVNGVGKTTVLDSLAYCCAAVVRHAHRQSRYGRSFEADDIRLGAGALQVRCDLECGRSEFGLSLRRIRDGDPIHGTAEWSRENSKANDNQTKEEFYGEFPTDSDGGKPDGQVLTVLFSTGRSVATYRSPRRDIGTGPVARAFASALSNRGLQLGEFAEWMLVQQVLSPERKEAQRMLTAVQNAVERFLPGYSNLRLARDGRKQSLLIDHDTESLPVHHLSDGERGVLAVVLDLTRRLAQANPAHEDPASEAEAIVLVDEIELHLHPAWQRRIVQNLTGTFPKCQFIATTHSPQIIGEVPADRIQIIANGGVSSPRRSFGLDSSHVLDEVMDTTPRTAEVHALLDKITQDIGLDRYDRAKEHLADLVLKVGESDAEVIRVRTLLDFLGEDE